MTFEIDHIFIWTDIGATVADRLISLGLTEGSSNIHPGQGTTNRRFFFHNAMLELLWVHDPEEAQSELIRRIAGPPEILELAPLVSVCVQVMILVKQLLSLLGITTRPISHRQ